jgi:hypothetical protein
MNVRRLIRRVIAQILAVILVAAGLGQLGTGAVFAASWLTGWSNRVQLAVDHTRVTGVLTNFPVMVHISSTSGTNGANISHVFGTVSANSQRIAVTTGDGTSQCYVEIVGWDTASNQAWLWVKVPSLSSTVDTILYLYYDNGKSNNIDYVGLTGSIPAQNVWDDNFVAVWHLAQNGNGTSAEFVDSTGRHNNGQGGSGFGYGTPTLTTSSTPMGVAQSFNGSNNCIRVPDADAFSVTTTGQMTVSAWMSPSMLNQPTSTGGYTRWLGKSALGAHEWQFVYYDQSYSNRSQWMSYYNYNASGGIGAGDYSTGSFPVNSWVYITGTSTSTSSSQGIEYIYRNAGVHSGNADSWQSYGMTYANGPTPVTIGTGWLGCGNFFAGRIGEVRVSNVTRSTAWIAASYYSESDKLISYGTPETGTAGIPPAVTTNAAGNIGTSTATINGSVTSLGTASSIGLHFDYGLTTSYGSSTPVQTITTTGAFGASLIALTAGTTYHYRTSAVGDGTAYGPDQTLTTLIPSVALEVATNALPSGTVGTAYSQTMVATGGTTNYTWTIVAGSLPAGLSLGSGGAIAGTPTAPGGPTYVTFRVTDSEGVAATRTLSITVCASVAFDVNADGVVNVLDMISIGQHWGETGAPGWIRQDVNGDSVVNVLDQIVIGQHWTG